MRWRTVLSGAAVALLVVHFAVIMLSNLPEGPLKRSTAAFVGWYTDPIFAQSWQLFSPDPIVSDIGTLLRVRYPDGRVSDWADPLSPLIDRVHRSPLTADRQVFLFQALQTMSVGWEDSKLRAERDRLTDDPAKRYVVVPISESERSRKERADRFRAALATRYADRYLGGGWSAVQVRLVAIPAIPLPGSDSGDRSTPDVMDFDWQDRIR
ncbi:DUF5819 family protein [Nocardia terpenica]|uniref:Uncharacterized protein n=1 Tax=Nocardia terpenica TaxID=455432 RepID=A0A291RF89_9NOCA|nr:DUF5819 family protein [Nocardia terpenica]ATL65978.1 hypothetical protein CRH09_06905 [Nocardia terpenica]